VIASHAEPLIAAMKFFIANVATLCEKTMEDTLWSISSLNDARVDYDGMQWPFCSYWRDLAFLVR
jgi:hypothetical protein